MADTFFHRSLPKMVSPMTGEEMDDFNCPESIDYDGLNQILDKKKGINYSTTLHSDQGSVYSSMAFTVASIRLSWRCLREPHKGLSKCPWMKICTFFQANPFFISVLPFLFCRAVQIVGAIAP